MRMCYLNCARRQYSSAILCRFEGNRVYRDRRSSIKKREDYCVLVVFFRHPEKRKVTQRASRATGRRQKGKREKKSANIREEIYSIQ